MFAFSGDVRFFGHLGARSFWNIGFRYCCLLPIVKTQYIFWLKAFGGVGNLGG